MTVSTKGPVPQTPGHGLRPPTPDQSARRVPSPRPARRLATLASAVAAALVGMLLIATPAHAAGEIKVTIDGLADSLPAGGIDDFRATFINESREAITGVFAVVVVALPGAVPEAIWVQRNGGADLPREVIGDGTVVFTDPNAFDLGRGGGNARRRIEFTIFFADGTPDSEAVVTVGAYARGELLGSASTSIEVRGVTTTPPNTDPGVVPTFEAGPTYSIAPIPEAAVTAPPSSMVPTTVYVLGALLVVMGLMTLVLVFWAPGRQFAGGPGPSGAGGPEPDRRRPMVWPTHRPATAGPRAPRPAYPSEPGRSGPLGSDAARSWPVVTRPVGPPPVAYPASGATPPVRDPGPATGYGRAVSDSGPSTGTGRALRDPGPRTGGGRPLRDAAPEDPWRYD